MTKFTFTYTTWTNRRRAREEKKLIRNSNSKSSTMSDWMERNETFFFSFRLLSDMQSIYSRDLPKWNIIVSICSEISFFLSLRSRETYWIWCFQKLTNHTLVVRLKFLYRYIYHLCEFFSAETPIFSLSTLQWISEFQSIFRQDGHVNMMEW